ncbi:n1r/p28-like protein [Albatrosspox virus]|nr:n1r/p28-like protein [Penguinpox virus 2]QRM16185.1 n1r/p28-like protein [Albatrosspox virus]
MDLSVIVTDHIDDRFSWVRYDDFEIIVMKENGYVNATKLCILGNRRLSDWLNMESTKELIREAEYVNRNWKAKSFYTDDIKGVILDIESEDYVYEVSGCYIHQDLISHITSWISPLFSLKVSKIMNYYTMSKYERELRDKEDINKEFLKLLKGLYKKHDNDIVKLKERYREQRKNIKRLETKYDNEIEELKLRNVNTECKEVRQDSLQGSNRLFFNEEELVTCTSTQSDLFTNDEEQYDVGSSKEPVKQRKASPLHELLTEGEGRTQSVLFTDGEEIIDKELKVNATRDIGICNSHENFTSSESSSSSINSIQIIENKTDTHEKLSSRRETSQRSEFLTEGEEIVTVTSSQKTLVKIPNAAVHNGTCEIIQSKDSKSLEKNSLDAKNTQSIADKLRRFRFEGSSRSAKCHASTTSERPSKYFS